MTRWYEPGNRKVTTAEHDRFIYEQYQELFALCQALPGPGSTKMIYCINVIHGGFTIGLLSFFVWRYSRTHFHTVMHLIKKSFSLPAAIAIYGLSLGIARVNESLPALVYALLTGLNAATVGIIALAAVQLSQKAITDKVTRILVFLGGTAGMLYNALWYFPILMFAGGATTVIWDYRWVQKVLRRLKPKAENAVQEDPETPFSQAELQVHTPAHMRSNPTRSTQAAQMAASGEEVGEPMEDEERRVPASLTIRVFSWKFGIMVIASFFVTFIIIMTLRGVLNDPPRGLSLFANLYLAGMCLPLGSAPRVPH